MSLLPFEEAQRRLLADVAPTTQSQTVPITKAAGRVLFENVHALRTQPSFDASAMDGYAIRATDVRLSPVDLRLVGESAAGRAYGGMVGPGEAVRIFTGAPLPAGADAVVIQENTSKTSNGVRILEAAELGSHIRRAGNDFEMGSLLGLEGTLLGPASTALIASGGHGEVLVRRSPRVAIAATGDELVLPGTTPGPSQIVACNGIALSRIVESAGGEVIDLGLVQDRDEDLVECLARADDAQADVLVTIGGASVGDYDLVGPVFRREGVNLDFWKVAMRPGKPLMAGHRGKLRVLGLPGNPASCIVTAELFLKPLVERLTGRQPQEMMQCGILGVAVKANDHRMDFLRATIHADPKTGLRTVTPLSRQDSSLLSVFAQADALLIRQPHARVSEAGEPCYFVALTM